MAQLINITSEALQATVRRLLPSQQGFGEDLQATNVVTPIIDLTPTAEGSALPLSLSNALAHSSNTAFDVTNSTSTLTTTPGFYLITLFSSISVSTSTTRKGAIEISDGSTATELFLAVSVTGSASEVRTDLTTLVCFVRAGDTLQVNTGAGVRFAGSFRQIADVNGNITNPVGFIAT